MAFFKARQTTTGDPFLDHVVSIQSDDYTTSFISVRALRNSDVFAAVRIIASDIASSPIQLMKDSMPQADNDLVKLLNERPNSEMDGWHFKFALAVNMLLNGNSFAEIKQEGEKVKELHLLPNSSVTVTQADNGTLSYQIGDKKRRVKSEDILHFKYFTQDGLTGLPPLYALRDEMKIQQAGNRTLHNFFARGVSGSGILKVHKSDLDGSAKNAIREKFEEANGSSSGDNALRTIILDETMDYKALEINTDVLKLVNSSDWTTKQIAKAFGVPIERLGVENEHSSTIQSNLQYIQSTLIHYFNVFVSEFDAKIKKDNTDVFRFNSEGLLESDPETRITNILEQVKGSILTINEGRSKLGLPPVDGGDRLLASLNFTYLDTLERYQLEKMEGTITDE
ncbi:phage portal protein [Enterococcus sp. DIV0800]|uniref:phage portal protein n=1 Tax=unclassified Enterococcus TaxID=2608891 RepID=UPI003D2FF0F0